MKVLKFPIITLTGCFILGIIAANRYHPDTTLLLPIFFIFLVSLTFLHWKYKSYQILKVFYSLTSWLIAFVAGVLTFLLHYPLNHQNHYSQLIDSGEKYLIEGKISDILKPNNYTHKYFIELESLNNLPIKGKSMVNFSRKNPEPPPSIGTKIIAYCEIKALIKPNNPNQFNYADYLEKKGVFHQIYLEKSNFTYKEIEENLNYHLQKTREKIIQDFKENDISPEALEILKALLLGQKQDIQKELLEQYSKAGAVHILAISGLHIGILLFFFKAFFSPLNRFKNGRLIQLVLIIFLLWTYALLAGMSPSVVRAVTMFSFVGIGMYMKRATNIFNTICSSILLLLIFKPNFLFEVGFQLSYAAVFAIVWIQPLFTKLYRPKNKILNYFYEIFTVSIAAQLGVFPLSIYYFHQFPSLFFITNLVVIPMLTVMLVIGLVNIILNFLGLGFLGLGKVLSFATEFNNQFVSKVASFDQLVFSDIPFNVYLVLITYAVIIGLFLFLKKPGMQYLTIFLFFVMSFQGIYFYTRFHHYHQKELIIYQYPRKSILTIKNGDEVSVHSTDSLINQNYVLKNYLQGNFATTKEIKSIKETYLIGKEKLLIVNEKNIYKTPEKADFILLTQTPKINVERLIDHHQPKMIIADGSNYKNTVKKWQETCNKKNIPFHYTDEKGYVKFTFN
jgi:competence protein ComEC